LFGKLLDRVGYNMMFVGLFSGVAMVERKIQRFSCERIFGRALGT
jgi:hypothetical protein